VAKTILLGLIIVASTSIAVAQDDYKRWEIFGGYSRNNVDSGISDSDPELGFIDVREGFNGFNASVTGNLTRYFGLKFDVSGHYKTQTIPFTSIAHVDVNSRLYNFLGGVQVKDNSAESTFKPFAHALVGAAHGRNRVNFSNDFCVAFASIPAPCPFDFTDSETGFAGAFGGGLDIRVSNRIDIRAIQIDYNPTRLGDSTQHNIRIGVGLVFH
jgi:opacity protein-like surface antigen